MYLLRGRGGILLHFFVFSFSFFPTRKQDEDYSIFSYRCLERFARYLHFLWNTISFRPNKSRFSFPSSREGGGGRGGGLSRNCSQLEFDGTDLNCSSTGREIGRSNRADLNCIYLLASSRCCSLPSRLISDETTQSRGEALFPHQRDQATVRQLWLDRRFVLARVGLLMASAPCALLLPRVLLLLQRLLLGTSVHVNAAEAVY